MVFRVHWHWGPYIGYVSVGWQDSKSFIEDIQRLKMRKLIEKTERGRSCGTCLEILVFCFNLF